MLLDFSPFHPESDAEEVADLWEDFLSQLFLSFWCLCQEDDCEPWLPRSQWESWDLGSSQWESSQWESLNLKSIQPEFLVLGCHSCEQRQLLGQ